MQISQVSINIFKTQIILLLVLIVLIFSCRTMPINYKTQQQFARNDELSEYNISFFVEGCKRYVHGNECITGFSGVYKTNEEKFIWLHKTSPTYGSTFSLELGHFAIIENGKSVVRSLNKGAFISLLEKDADINDSDHLLYSKNDKYLISSNYPASILLWDTANYKIIKKISIFQNNPDELLHLEREVNSITSNRKGNQIAVRLGDGTLTLIDLNNYKMKTMRLNKNIFDARINQDNTNIFIHFSGENIIRIFNINSFNEVRAFPEGSYFLDFENSPDGKYIVTSGGRTLINILNLINGDRVIAVGKVGDYGKISFTNDSKYICSTMGGNIFIWRMDGSLVKEYRLPNGLHAYNAFIIEKYF